MDVFYCVSMPQKLVQKISGFFLFQTIYSYSFMCKTLTKMCSRVPVLKYVCILTCRPGTLTAQTRHQKRIVLFRTFYRKAETKMLGFATKMEGEEERNTLFEVKRYCYFHLRVNGYVFYWCVCTVHFLFCFGIKPFGIEIKFLWIFVYILHYSHLSNL